MRDSKWIKTNRSQATMHPGSRPTDTPLAPLSEVGMLADGSTPLLKIPATSKLALHDNKEYVLAVNKLTQALNKAGSKDGTVEKTDFASLIKDVLKKSNLWVESNYPKNALLKNLER